MSLSLLSRSHVHTSGTKPAVCLLGFLVIVLNGQPAKYIFPLIRQKAFCKKTKKGGMAHDVTNRGGSGGASPPAFTRTTITSKSPSEAVFIISSPHLLTPLSTTMTVLSTLRGGAGGGESDDD